MPRPSDIHRFDIVVDQSGAIFSVKAVETEGIVRGTLMYLPSLRPTSRLLNGVCYAKIADETGLPLIRQNYPEWIHLNCVTGEEYVGAPLESIISVLKPRKWFAQNILRAPLPVITFVAALQ